MARVKNGDEAVEVLNTFLSTHADMTGYKINDLPVSIYFETQSDLFDIESDFEKGLPARPIVTIFLSSEPRGNIGGYSKLEPILVIQVAVPHKDRHLAYSEARRLALVICKLIDEKLPINNAYYDSFREIKTSKTTRLSKRDFSEKGILIPQRIDLITKL